MTSNLDHDRLGSWLDRFGRAWETRDPEQVTTPADREMHIELDGILLISLDDEGRCRDFREWSNRRECSTR